MNDIRILPTFCLMTVTSILNDIASLEQLHSMLWYESYSLITLYDNYVFSVCQCFSVVKTNPLETGICDKTGKISFV